MRNVIDTLRTQISELQASYNETVEQYDYYNTQLLKSRESLFSILRQIKDIETAIERITNG